MPATILAVLTDAKTAASCLSAAAAAARRVVDADIVALHVIVDPDVIVSSSEEVAFQQLREHYEGTAKQRAAAVRSVYDEWLASVPPAGRARVTWRQRIGPEQANVVAEAAGADLLVLARAYNMDAGDARFAAIYQCGRPLLLVPTDFAASRPLGHHVVIAWKPSAEARAAIAGAERWLCAADQVTVIALAANAAAASLDECQAILTQIGVSAVAQIVEPRSGDDGVQILGMVDRVGADLLVMGAYHRAAMMEWIFGGVTRHVLADAAIPVLMAHR